MEPNADKYANFVEHPRFGKGPRCTGLNPGPLAKDVSLHWLAVTHQEMAARYEQTLGEPWPYGSVKAESSRTRRIPGTAVEADLSRQTPATVPVTHYFDMPRVCRDCGRPFLFFAEEQKHWYEDLGFPLEADCVRCTDCRKQQREIARLRKRFEELIQVRNRTIEQGCELADCCLTLMEDGLFTIKQSQRVRTILNSIPADADIRQRSRFTDLVARVKVIESRSSPDDRAQAAG